MTKMVKITLKGISDQAYNMKRHAEVSSNPEAIQLYNNAHDALVALFNFQLKHNCPMDAEFIATDNWVR